MVSVYSEDRDYIADFADCRFRITAYTDEIIRVQAGPAGVHSCPEGFFVVKRDWKPVDVTVKETERSVEYSTAVVTLVIDKTTPGITYKDKNGSVLTSGTYRRNTEYVGMKHRSEDSEHFFGFGLQLHSLDSRGKLRVIKTNADPPTDTGNAHAPDPMFYSTHGYAIFLNSAGYSIFDMCRSEKDEYTFSAPEQSLDFFFIYGPEFNDISANQTLLRGRMSMPAKWGLGFWYRMPSKWESDRIIERAEEFRKREIPCDVIGLEPRWQTNTYPCTYVWNLEYYPNPKEFVKRMRDNGFHVNLWEHEWVHPDSPVYPQLRDKNLLADRKGMGGYIPDFTFDETRDIFARQHKSEHIDLGVDGYKLDECDGSDYTGPWFYPDDTTFPSGLTGAQMHNLTGFLYNKAFHEMFENWGIRTYLLLRANFAGGQRYPSVIYSDYYRLNQYIRGQAASGFSGFLWCPELREASTDEEFMRRAQNMFFSAMAMINAWAGSEELLPWSRGKEIEDIFRKYVQLRMRLIPYIYSSIRHTHKTGIPFIRAMVMDYPDDPAAFTIDDEFMFGDSMLVAPVESGSSRDVYLPKGRWTDFWSNKVYDGNATITVDAPLDMVPVFVRAGGVITMGPSMQFVGEKPVEEIELHVYPGEGKFTLYDDDGSTMDYADGDYAEVEITVSGEKVKIGELSGRYKPEWKTFLVKIHNADGIREYREELNMR